MNILLLAALVLTPPERLCEFLSRAAPPIRALQLYKKALDLKEHLAPATPDIICRIFKRTLTQWQRVYGGSKGRVHEQILHSCVHVACGRPKSTNLLVNQIMIV